MCVDQSVRMHRRVLAFAGCTYQSVGNLVQLVGSKRNKCMYAGKILERVFCPFDFPSLPCDLSINQLLWILLLFLRLPIVFYLDTIKLFYDDCRLLVTFENSLDQDQVTLLCVCMCVCVSVCLSVRERAFACLHIGAD